MILTVGQISQHEMPQLSNYSSIIAVFYHIVVCSIYAVQCKPINCNSDLKNCKISCSKIPGYSDDVQIDLSALDGSGGPR